MNVLFADPNEEVAHLINLYLTEDGHKTKRVRNATEVIKEFETGKYDKVVLSLTVPLSENVKNREGGAVKKLKAKFPKALVLIASGFSPEQLIRMGIVEDSPSLRYIEKPFTQEKFIKAINS